MAKKTIHPDSIRFIGTDPRNGKLTGAVLKANIVEPDGETKPHVTQVQVYLNEDELNAFSDLVTKIIERGKAEDFQKPIPESAAVDKGTVLTAKGIESQERGMGGKK